MSINSKKRRDKKVRVQARKDSALRAAKKVTPRIRDKNSGRTNDYTSGR